MKATIELICAKMYSNQVLSVSKYFNFCVRMNQTDPSHNELDY